MAELILVDVDDKILCNLRQRATRHGRTLSEEAKAILSTALHSESGDDWGAVDMIYHRLEASGQTFSDSADLLREDRCR